MYDDNPFLNTPSELDLTGLERDMIDERKAKQLSRSWRSAFTVNQGQVLQPVLSKRDAKAVLLGLTIYLYRGRKARFHETEFAGGRFLQNMVEALEKNPSINFFHDLTRHNIWAADLVASDLLSEFAGSLSNGARRAAAKQGGQGSGGQSEGDAHANGEGQPEGKGESKDQGDNPLDGGKGGSTSGGSVNHDPHKVGGMESATAKRLEGAASKALKETKKKIEKMKDPSGGRMIDALADARGFDESEASPLFGHRIAGKITDKMGRMKEAISTGMNDKVYMRHSTPVKVTYGDDIKNALKSQFVHFGEVTEPILIKQIMERQLMQRQLQGVVRAGKGPIIMCIDTSGSMRQGDGELQAWAYALAGVIGWAAARKRREVAFVYYSSTVPDILHLPSKYRQSTGRLERAIHTIVHNPMMGSGKPHPLSVIPDLQKAGIEREVAGNNRWYTDINGGGTNYAMAFDAVNALMTLHKRWRSADVLFLSDGADAGDKQKAAEMAARLQKRNVRIYGIGLVPGDEDFHHKAGMAYFDHVAVANVTKDTNAESLLTVIGRNL